MKPIVAIQPCDTYETTKVYDAVAKAVEATGGLASFIKPGDRVLLKINLLNTAPPEKAVTTHPEVTRAMIRLIRDFSAEPIVADAPGLDLAGYGKRVLRTSGTLAMCEEEGAKTVLFTERGYEVITVEDNVHLKTLHIPREVLEADAVVSMAKAKSHMQAIYTGAIKNFFGVIPQHDRKIAHALPGMEQFSETLVDILAAVRPHFAVMDGIVGMEGNGPANGPTRNLGLILASSDLVALDTVTSACMGYGDLDIPHIRQANQRGLGENDLEKIEIAGPPINEVKDQFKPPQTSSTQAPAFVNKLAMRLWRVEPKVTNKCVLCGHCEAVCPVGAITIGEKAAVIDYAKCLNCFCCHELCPSGAIKERTSFAVKAYRLAASMRKDKT